MPKNLLLKTNDILIDISSQQNKAIKKSIEFFIGKMISTEEIKNLENFTAKNSQEKIAQYLTQINLCIREAAIQKKFLEYYIGKEFIGYIKEIELIIDKKKLEKLTSKHNIILLLIMSKEESEYLIKRLKLDSFKIITASSVNDGIKIAKETITEFTYIGNSLQDYQITQKEKIPFIGINMKESTKDIKIIKNIDEI